MLVQLAIAMHRHPSWCDRHVQLYCALHRSYCFSFSSGPRSGPLECPLCGESYSADSVAALQEHVQQHMEDVVECPVCSKTFERAGSQAVFEEHVQKHFQDQVLYLNNFILQSLRFLDYFQEESIQIRGWDLGID